MAPPAITRKRVTVTTSISSKAIYPIPSLWVPSSPMNWDMSTFSVMAGSARMKRITNL